MIIRRLIKKIEPLRLLKFAIAGLLSIAIGETLMFIFVEFAKVWYIVSSIIAGEVLVISDFTINSFWTFKDRRIGWSIKKALTRLVRYNLFCFTCAPVSLSALWTFTELAGFHYLISYLFSIAIAGLWLYGLSLRWVWR